jgi:hypothetical protein
LSFDHMSAPVSRIASTTLSREARRRPSLLSASDAAMIALTLAEGVALDAGDSSNLSPIA